MRYFDASALVKRYVRERGSAKVRRLIAEGAATSRLSEVEIASALKRRARERALSPAERDRALVALRRDFPAFLAVELTPQITESAQELLSKYSLRSGDAIQLASCLFLQKQLRARVPFVGFDERLVEAARNEGLSLR